MKNRSDDRGFTLVEVVVAMLIFTVGIVAMAQLMAVTIHMQAQGRNQTSAVRIAQDKLDQLMALVTLDPPEVQITDPGVDSLAANVANYFDTDIPGYTRRWLIEAGPNDGHGEILRQITIRVIPDVQDRRTYVPYELVSMIRPW